MTTAKKIIPHHVKKSSATTEIVRVVVITSINVTAGILVPIENVNATYH